MKKRYTVRYKPATKTEKAMLRGMGVFHAIFGTVFALIALTVMACSACSFWRRGYSLPSTGR